nr:RNA-directed DNA polymerase, eukaryota [Tanacetum cinerariifolium]
IPDNCVAEAAKSIGCSIMKAPFKYLGILVGDNMSSIKAWDETISKMKKRLSRWKLNTLSVGDRDRKIAWVKWSKVLAFKKYGRLGVSSFYALNRALLFKWVWRYLSYDNSLWFLVISAIHGLNGQVLSAAFNSTWSSIINEVNSLKDKGVDLISHSLFSSSIRSRREKILLLIRCARLSLFLFVVLSEEASSLNNMIIFRYCLIAVILSNMEDRWFWDLNGDAVFRVKDVRILLDEAFLPKMEVPTRWIKSIPIKVNVFAWKLFLDRLPTRSNLARRNVSIPSLACPLCDLTLKDSSHLFFGCFVAKDVQKLICRWWNLDFQSFDSYDGRLS